VRTVPPIARDRGDGGPRVGEVALGGDLQQGLQIRAVLLAHLAHRQHLHRHEMRQGRHGDFGPGPQPHRVRRGDDLALDAGRSTEQIDRGLLRVQRRIQEPQRRHEALLFLLDDHAEPEAAPLHGQCQRFRLGIRSHGHGEVEVLREAFPGTGRHGETADERAPVPQLAHDLHDLHGTQQPTHAG